MCVACWTRVSDFNEFYLSVEKAHRLLTERFSLKGGEQHEKASSPKQEQPSDESKELSLRSDQDADDDFGPDESLYVSGAESEAAASFSNEQFLNDVLAQQPSEEQSEVKQVPQQEAMPERRETRATRAKSKANQALANESLPSAVTQATPATKRRGRSKSEKSSNVSIVEDVPKNKRYVDYKKSMLEIDAKIAKHMRLNCNICHEVQETFLLLCKHMMQVHHCKGYAVCCNKKFYKRSFLTDHIDRHSNPEKFK